MVQVTPNARRLISSSSRVDEMGKEFAGTIPWFAYLRGNQTFYYDFVRKTYVESNVPWLRRTVCKDVHSATGWLLLQDLDSLQISMFHPSTYQRKLLPIPKVKIKPGTFACRFASTPPDCHIVAVTTSRLKFFLHCPPNGEQWSKNYPLPLIDRKIDKVNDAILYQGKIWAVGNPEYVICIDVNVLGSELPIVTCLRFKMVNPSPYSLKLCDSYLVKTAGEIFNVQVYNQDDVTYTPRALVVLKLTDFSAWTMVESIGNKIFLLGQHYSSSIATDVKDGNMIYFNSSTECNPYTFNLHDGSLTAHYHNKTWDIKMMPYWVLFGAPPQRNLGKHEIGNIKESINNQSSQVALPTKLQHAFSNPKHLTIRPTKNLRTKDELFNTLSSPQTPWLMIKDGCCTSQFKLFDPCTNLFYSLDVPELSDKQLSYSKDGWLVASGAESNILINPFTKEIIELSSANSMLGSISLSSSPTDLRECLVFSIVPEYDDGDIHLLRLSDNSVTYLKYTNNTTLYITYSSPVYHNGLFYCLCIEGNLGIYDPAENSWSFRLLSCPKDLDGATLCFLFESNGELMSLFLDGNMYPIGVFGMDMPNRLWKEVKHLGNRTLFAGSQGSFIVAAPERRMANKIYLPKFRKRDDYELCSYDVGAEYTFDEPFTTEEYEHIWVEPKNVRLGLDQSTGKFCYPTIFLPSFQS